MATSSPTTALPQPIHSLLHLRSGVLPLYLYYFPALFALITLSQALPPTRYRVPLTLPLLILISAQLWLHDWDIGPQQVVGTVEWLWQYVFYYFDRVYLENPDREGWCRTHISDGEQVVQGRKSGGHGGAGRDDVEKLRVPDTFRARLWWSFTSMISPRGVGWSWQVNGVPPASCDTKW